MVQPSFVTLHKREFRTRTAICFPDFEKSARRYVDRVQARDFKGAAKEFGGVDLEMRARMCVAAVVLWKGDVPEDWLLIARRSLFPFERPYL